MVKWKFARIGALAAALATMMAAGCGDGRPDAARYNVLLISIDTTRADHLGAYGYQKQTSTNLDALAADGVQFDFAMSTSGLTPIAHASIFTGLNPYDHGVRVMYGPPGHYLSKNIPTLATLLKDAGYDTGAFVSAYSASERYGMQWGFGTFENGMEKGALEMDPTHERGRGLTFAHGRWVDQREGVAQRRADSTADQAIEWLDTAERPFLQWVHFFDPHDPWLIPPHDYMQKYGVRRKAEDSMLTVYDADIDFMDAQIGRLIRAYKDRGLYDKTIIMVIADHGQGLNDHDWFRHRILYREQIRVPLILRLPDGPRARRVTELVRNIDLLPTVGEALGIDMPDNITGVSLLGLIDGKPEPPRIAYAEALNSADVLLPDEMPERHKDLLFCVMDRNWKLIHHKEHPENSELYDLTNDPHERINVIAEYPDEQIRLMEILESTGGLAVRTTGAAPIDDETLRGLEALGYVDGDGEGG